MRRSVVAAVRVLALTPATALLLCCAGPARSSSTRRPAATAGRAAPPACSPLRAGGSNPLVDDFESDRAKILGNEGRDGWWFGYDDGSGGRFLMERAGGAGGEGTGRALHVAASGFSRWGAGFGATLHPATSRSRGCAYDASTYSGVRLRVRGRGRLRVMLADAASTPVAQGGTCERSTESCYDRPGISITLEERWTTHDLPFCALFPEGWSGATDGVDPARLFAFHFQVGLREDADAWIDDLGFYRATDGAPPPHCGRPCPLDLAPSSARIEPASSTARLDKQLSLHTFEQPISGCAPLTRRYLSYVPDHLGKRSPAPVMFVLHGMGGNAESARTFQAKNRFDALADRDGFIVVYGNGAPGARTWSGLRTDAELRPRDPAFANSGFWRQSIFQDGQVDDLDYIQRVLGDLAARGVVEGTNPVFLVGHSNGGGMVLEAARRMPDRFRGVAALMPFDGPQPVQVPDISHTGLTRVLIAYSIGDPGHTDGYHEHLAALPARWATALGLPASAVATPRRSALPDTVIEGRGYEGSNAAARSTRGSRASQLDIEAPGVAGRVRVLVLDHAGHFWPNPTPDTDAMVIERYGFRNQDLDAADAVWDFLRSALDVK